MDKPQLLRVGRSQEPVVVVDRFSGAVAELVDFAAAVPIPLASGSYYPGLRRGIEDNDPAYPRIAALIEAAAPFVGGAFDLDRFDLVEASFSMVTLAPEALAPPQRAPHFDATDPDHIAMMLYLSDTPGTGTAFFRQRATGIERVDAANVGRFVATARDAPAKGYIAGSDPHYEEIGRVEAKPDRLLLYRGALLHSGIIPPDMDRSADPRRGRLTLNIFLQGRR